MKTKMDLDAKTHGGFFIVCATVIIHSLIAVWTTENKNKTVSAINLNL